jgi:hypothetical protein
LHRDCCSKDRLFNRDKVAQIAGELSHAHWAFDAAGFENQVMSRLPELELKQRIAWITDCLETHLLGSYRRAVNVMVRSLPAPATRKCATGTSEISSTPLLRVHRAPRLHPG